MTYDFILDELDIRAEPFALCELRGKCDLGLGRDTATTLHYVLAGQGELLLPKRPPLPVQRDTLILVPAFQPHTLRSFGGQLDPIPVCKPADLNLMHLVHQAEQARGEDQLLAVCARVTISLRDVHGLIDLVREPMAARIPARDLAASPLRQILVELSNPGLGSRAMVRALLLQCVIGLLRDRLAVQDSGVAWMAALKDRTLWNALRRMLDAPAEPHSVESLAAEAGMSRSTFAARFSQAYGSGPMELLRDLRMRMASALLVETDLPVKRIAEKVGFQSRSAFTRTFIKVIGESPQGFRAKEHA